MPEPTVQTDGDRERLTAVSDDAIRARLVQLDRLDEVLRNVEVGLSWMLHEVRTLSGESVGPLGGAQTTTGTPEGA